VEDTIDISGDWGKTLAGKPMFSDVDPWRLAVVLEVSKDAAKIGLRPGRTSTGALVEERETGVIPFEEVRWARPALARGLGGAPGSVAAVLKPGDVIYAAPRKPKLGEDGKPTQSEGSLKGQWSLVQPPGVGGALVAMDPHTGRVLAIAGGFSFAQSQFVRATQARRQPGSAFKPLIYTMALDNGYTPSSIIVDGRICIDQGRGMPQWCPKNYDAGSAAGPSTLRFGIEKSRNLMTVRLARDMGMPIIVDYSKRFGVYDNLMPALSMSLGAGETTLLRMTTGYSVIANGGKQIKPTFIDRIQDRYGRTVWRHDARDCSQCAAREWSGQTEPALVDVREQVIDPIAAYQMTMIMDGVVQRGTATRLKILNRPIAGKTGTTNDYKDAWFVGYTPDLAVGVYVGFDQPKPMGRGETGGSLAAPIVRDFVKEALEGVPAVPFRAPSGVKLVRVNHKSGLPAAPGDKSAIMEAFKPGLEPAGAVGAEPEGHDPEAMASDDYPPFDGEQPQQAGPPPGFPPAGPPPGFPPGGHRPPPASDRALTSGTGGLY
jgi:penicillin-binding protein 1A